VNRQPVEDKEHEEDFGLEQPEPNDEDVPEWPRKSTQRRRGKSAKRRASNNELGKLTQFGWILAVCGGLSFVLPAFGIQIKGLHRLSPEAQTIGGVLFLLVGGLILAVTYGRQFLGPWFTDLPHRSRRMIVIACGLLAVLVLGVSLLVVGPRLLAEKAPGRNVDSVAADAPQVVQPSQPTPGGLADPGDPTGVSPSQNLPRPPSRASQTQSQPQPTELGHPGGVSFGQAGNPPGMAGHRPGLAGHPPRIAGAPPGFSDVPPGIPGAPPGFSGPPQGNMSLEERFAAIGPQRVVSIVFSGQSEPVKYAEMLDRLRRLDPGIQLGSGGGSGQTFTLRLAPIDDIQAFADKIDIGTVTQVNPATRVIEIKLP
jgi:hypothetical protein